jgi:methylenetetrahydrofolate reductase (NADPH)
MGVKEDIANKVYHIELLTPKQATPTLEADLQQFAERYVRILDDGFVVCIPDNPMGVIGFQAADVIAELELPVKPGRISMHLNTFHAKTELHKILDTAAALGVDNVLVVSGDGGERLTRIAPAALGLSCNVVTSVELLAYIRTCYPGTFTLGVAYNPYEPQAHELEKTKRKIDADADFICTQPLLGRDQRVLELKPFGLPIFKGCWMSRKVHLLSKCVGYPIPEDTPYDPLANLKELQALCEDCGLYLALLNYKNQFPLLKGLWT